MLKIKKNIKTFLDKIKKSKTVYNMNKQSLTADCASGVQLLLLYMTT